MNFAYPGIRHRQEGGQRGSVLWGLLLMALLLLAVGSAALSMHLQEQLRLATGSLAEAAQSLAQLQKSFAALQQQNAQILQVDSQLRQEVAAKEAAVQALQGREDELNQQLQAAQAQGRQMPQPYGPQLRRR